MQSPAFGLAGVMGWPVAHSRSPKIHGYWLQKHGLQGAYVLLPVAPGQLPVACRDWPHWDFAAAT